MYQGGGFITSYIIFSKTRHSQWPLVRLNFKLSSSPYGSRMNNTQLPANLVCAKFGTFLDIPWRSLCRRQKVFLLTLDEFILVFVGTSISHLLPSPPPCPPAFHDSTRMHSKLPSPSLYQSGPNRTRQCRGRSLWFSKSPWWVQR